MARGRDRYKCTVPTTANFSSRLFPQLSKFRKCVLCRALPPGNTFFPVHLIPSVIDCFSYESREDDGSLCQPLQIVISRSGVTWFPSIEEENRDAVWPGPQNMMLADERRFACGGSLVRVFPKFHVELLGNVIIVGRSVFSRSRVARHEVFGSPNQIRLSRNILSVHTVVTWMTAWRWR